MSVAIARVLMATDVCNEATQLPYSRQAEHCEVTVVTVLAVRPGHGSLDTADAGDDVLGKAFVVQVRVQIRERSQCLIPRHHAPPPSPISWQIERVLHRLATDPSI